jgi:hypothetical protein
MRFLPGCPRTLKWSTVLQLGATCCTTKNNRSACSKLKVRATARRLFGPFVEIHVREE